MTDAIRCLLPREPPKVGELFSVLGGNTNHPAVCRSCPRHEFPHLRGVLPARRSFHTAHHIHSPWAQHLDRLLNVRRAQSACYHKSRPALIIEDRFSSFSPVECHSRATHC